MSDPRADFEAARARFYETLGRVQDMHLYADAMATMDLAAREYNEAVDVFNQTAVPDKRLQYLERDEFVARLVDMRAAGGRREEPPADPPGTKDLLLGFDTRINVLPSRDNRDEGGDCDSTRLHLILRGDLGAVTAVIDTGWVLRPLAGPYDRVGAQNRYEKPGVDQNMGRTYPFCYDAFVHAVFPRSGAGEAKDCPVLGAAGCWPHDISTRGPLILQKLIEGGHRAAFEYMAVLYESHIKEWAPGPGTKP